MSLVPFTTPVRIARPEDAPELSAAQTQFNELVATLEARRVGLVQWQKAQQHCLQQAAQVLAPLQRETTHQQMQWVTGLAGQLTEPAGDASWSRNERRLLERMVCELAKPLIAQTGDAHIKALYNQYSSVDYDDEVQADAAQFKALLSDVYGLNMVHAKGGTRADLLDHARQQMALEQDRAARRKDRRKERLQARELPPEQQAKEAAQKQRAAQTQQTIREVYRKLASALHPDREPDDQQRVRKTELMARVNQAYANKELLQLLSLQLELAHIDAEQLTALSHQRLMHYNQLLRDQLVEIDREIAHMASAVRHQLQVAPAVVLTAESAMACMEELIEAARFKLDEVRIGLAGLHDAPGLKRWLKARH